MLVLDEPCADVRERFHAGALDAPTFAEDPLLSRWARVQRRGLVADRAPHVEGVSGHELCERRERLESAFHAGSALLAPIAEDVRARAMLAVLADRDGVVLHRQGGEAFEGTAALVRLVEGAHWGEHVRGTNAIGTAIVENRPVAVLGGAHFETANASLFCYAAPVRDVYGEVLCVLDVTGPIAQHDASIGLAVRATSRALELALRSQLFQHAVEGGLAALTRVVGRAKGPAFVVDAGGALVCGNAEARALWGADEPVRAAELARWLRASGRAEPVRWAGGAGSARGAELVLEPIYARDGRVLALLASAASDRSARPVQASQSGLQPGPALVAPSTPELAAILGVDAQLVREKGRAQQLARTEIPVLLLAETGTGKELFARAIHAESPRKHGPFMAINCGALAGSLLESELFGHAPHAFTGASPKGADGKLAAAHGGTLFLDEVADMPLALQAALLRFLDDGAYFRVGESKARRADVRVVCATSRDLVARVRGGEFREDLFFRIQGACVRPPPLRVRSDRVWLAERLIADAGANATLTRAASGYIAEHAWPGNVRELKSAIAHALAMAPGSFLDAQHFPESLLTAPITPVAMAAAVDARAADTRAAAPVRTRDSLLRDAVDAALRSTGGNLSEAARKLRMARSTLYRILHKGEPGAGE